MNLYLDINNEVFNLADDIVEDRYSKIDAQKAINESGLLEFLRDSLKDSDYPIFEKEDFRFTVPCVSLFNKEELFSVYLNLIGFMLAISEICSLLRKFENDVKYWQFIRIEIAICNFIKNFAKKYKI